MTPNQEALLEKLAEIVEQLMVNDGINDFEFDAPARKLEVATVRAAYAVEKAGRS